MSWNCCATACPSSGRLTRASSRPRASACTTAGGPGGCRWPGSARPAARCCSGPACRPPGVAVAAALTLTVTAVGGPPPVRPPAVAAPSAHLPGGASAAAAGYTTGPGYTPYSGALPAANAAGTTDGSAILLTAARQVAKATQPAAERYWVTSAIAGNYLRVGPAADPYLLLDESQVQSWAARSPKDGSPDFAKQLGAAPVSAADRAAWQRDGSPTSWNYVGQSDGLADAQGYTSGVLRSLSMAGDPMSSLDASYGAQQFPIGGKSLTLAQLQALPADPAALKKLILGGGVAPGESPSAFLLDGVLTPILEMPVTPSVRAALYKMLAAMPGIQSLGEVTDPAGQQGEAVSYTAKYQNCAQITTRTANGRVPVLVLHHPGDPHHRPRHRTAASGGTALRGAAPRPAVDRPRPAVLLRDLRPVVLDQR